MLRRWVRWVWDRLPCIRHRWVIDRDPSRRWGSRTYWPRFVMCQRCGALDEFDTPQSREPWRDWG